VSETPVERPGGELSFDTVPSWHRTSGTWFRDRPALRIDLAGITRADGAGLALMIEWLRLGQAAGCKVELANMPEQVARVVRVNGLAEALGLPPLTR